MGGDHGHAHPVSEKTFYLLQLRSNCINLLLLFFSHIRFPLDDVTNNQIWEQVPFKKSTVAKGVILIAGGGTGLILFAVWFQNQKHGFNGKK